MKLPIIHHLADKGIERRDRRIQRQRKAIVDAAAALFAHKGYVSTTTKDIARVVDIGESTLYGYFSSKQEILEEILNQQAAMVDSLLVNLNDLQGMASFVDITDLLLDRLLEWTSYNRVVVAEAWTHDEILHGYVVGHWQPLMERLEHFVSMRVEAGIFRPINPAFGARMMIAIFIASILPVVRGVETPPTPAKRRELAVALVEMIANGLQAQNG